MPTSPRPADRNEYPLPAGQRWTATIGRVAEHVPGIGGDLVIVLCCRACAHQLVRLVPGDEVVLDGTMFFECSHCRSTGSD